MSNQSKVHGLLVEGDIAAETWPAYLPKYVISKMVVLAIAQCDFNVQKFMPMDRKDGITIYLVGNSRLSRLIAIDDNAPGVVLLLEDDGQGCPPLNTSIGRERVQLPIKPVRAMTLRQLIAAGYCGVSEQLELSKYENKRLSIR